MSRFKSTPLGDIVKEQQDYERKRAQQELCGFEFFQQVKGAIVLNGVSHDGTVKHVCAEPKGHQSPDSPCRCADGVKNR